MMAVGRAMAEGANEGDLKISCAIPSSAERLARGRGLTSSPVPRPRARLRAHDASPCSPEPARDDRVLGSGWTPFYGAAPRKQSHHAFGARAPECTMPKPVAPEGERALPWKTMSEADRVFPRREETGAQSTPSERRLVLSTPRKGATGGAAGGGRSRVVEVVHVRRSGPRPVEDRPRPTPWSVRAGVWPEGFRAKPPSPLPPRGIQPVAPNPARPTVHVMPMWEPPQQRSAQPAAEPAERPGGMAALGGRAPRVPKPRAPETTGRLSADPFSHDDGGANCIRCGYLVEPAREERGLMTCSGCG